MSVLRTRCSFFSPLRTPTSACFLFSYRVSFAPLQFLTIPTLATTTPSYQSRTPTYNGSHHAFVIYTFGYLLFHPDAHIIFQHYPPEVSLPCTSSKNYISTGCCEFSPITSQNWSRLRHPCAVPVLPRLGHFVGTRAMKVISSPELMLLESARGHAQPFGEWRNLLGRTIFSKQPNA